MSPLFSLAGRLAQVTLVGPALARAKRRAIRAAIGAGLVAGFGVAGIGYLLIAARLELERHIGVVWAPVAIGGFLCLCGLAAYLALLRPQRGAARKAMPDAPELGTPDIPAALTGAARQLGAQIANKPLQSLAAALAAGFAVTVAVRMLRRRQPSADASSPALGAKPPPRANGHDASEAAEAWIREAVRKELDRRDGRRRPTA